MAKWKSQNVDKNVRFFIIKFSIVMKDFLGILNSKEIIILTFRIFNLDASSEYYAYLIISTTIEFVLNKFAT